MKAIIKGIVTVSAGNTSAFLEVATDVAIYSHLEKWSQEKRTRAQNEKMRRWCLRALSGHRLSGDRVDRMAYLIKTLVRALSQLVCSLQ